MLLPKANEILICHYQHSDDLRLPLNKTLTFLIIAITDDQLQGLEAPRVEEEALVQEAELIQEEAVV